MDKKRTHNNSRTQYEQVTQRVRIFKRGTRYYANYQFNGRQMRPPLKTASKKQARLEALKIDAELETGVQNDRKKNDATITEGVNAYRDFLEVEGRAPKTLSKYNTVFERLISLASRRNTQRLSQVDLAFIDAYRRQRKRADAAPKTIHTEVTIVRQVINFALSRRLLMDDPLAGLRLQRPKPTEQPCWRPDEVEKILTACNDHYRSPLTILANTGMRVGELKHLTWPDIDFENGVLHVRAKDEWKPKTGDRRAIPMNPTVHRTLETMPRHGRWVFTAAPTKKYSAKNRQISERRMLVHLKRVLRLLGLEGKLHTFRHSFISTALIKGTPEAIVRSWVGHVDPAIMKLYTHIADVDSQAAMRRLSQPD